MSMTENTKKLQKKAAITLLVLLIARMGIFIPIPGINHYTFNNSIKQNSIIGFLNFFSGGGFSTIGIFALGIIPYINSSIMIQLLTKIIPQLEYWQKEEGESGKQKITQLTRYITSIWAILQSFSLSLWLKPYTFNWNTYFIFDCIIALTTGSIIIMWFAEIITEYGIGNGTSLIIFQNIISSIPKSLNQYTIDINNQQNIIKFLFLVILCITILTISIIIQESKRKIIIISAKQLGKISELNPQSYIPIKLNQGGVMPIVFASAAITLPAYLTQKINITNTLFVKIINNQFIYLTIYCVLIIAFSYLYSSIILNIKDITQNLQKMGATIPKVRPGSQTTNYLKNIMNKLTFIGACLLFIIAQLPFFIYNLTQLNLFKGLGTTSLLILVGVAIDTAKQIQTYIISEQYDNMIE